MRLPSTASRVCSSGACHSISSSKVRLASSIIAHSSPFTGASTRVSWLPSSGSPRELARRRAGSMVSTATFLPCAAMPSATEAETVVLPTPPEPAHTHTSLRLSIPSTLTRRRVCASALEPDLPRLRTAVALGVGDRHLDGGFDLRVRPERALDLSQGLLRDAQPEL